MIPVTPDFFPRRGGQAGMTLTALLVGLAVGTLVLSATLQAYLTISEGARDTLMQARLDQELRAALDVMRVDIRRAGHWDFIDADHGSDANADGQFDWRDLGTHGDGSGRFDSDADGDTDETDLTPLNNPFQHRYGQVNNDLCLDTDGATGDCASATCTAVHPSGDCLSYLQTGSCITYSYDVDDDGRIGIRACDASEDELDCPQPSGAPFDASGDEPYAWRSWYPPQRATPTTSIEMEMFGFRYRSGGIDMRVGRYGNHDIGLGCHTGRWERITSPDIQITDLQFQLTTTLRNASPDKARTDPCVTADLCQQIRSLEIRIAGQLADDPTTIRSLSSRIAVRNDRYVLMP